MPLADFGPSEAWMLMRAYRVYSWRIHGVFMACLRAVVGFFCLLIMRSCRYLKNQRSSFFLEQCESLDTTRTGLKNDT
jgi:hypothetical protein